MRMTLVLPGMQAGGAERVMSILASEWARRGHEVTLLALASPTEKVFYPLHPDVRYLPLDLVAKAANPIQGLRNNLERLWKLRQGIVSSRPEVVIAFTQMVSVKVALVTRGLGIPVFVCEHSMTSQQSFGPVWRRLRELSYPLATRVVVLTEAMKDQLPPRVHAIVIPNPVLKPEDGPPDGPTAPQSLETPLHTVIALGRLEPAKRFDRLIDAFAQIAPRHPDWKLVIWGEGSLRGELEAQRQRLGLAGQVFLPGLTRDPYSELKRAELMAMSSAFEGFPMVLCEALACGVPAVCFETQSGIRELMRDGIDGLIVPQGDVPALAEALSSLMEDGARRARMAARGPELLQRFGLDRVMELWAREIGAAQQETGRR